MIRPRLLFLILCLAPATLVGQVKTGADLLFEKQFKLIEGKRVGLVTNHSALLSNGKHLVDAIHKDKRTKLVALFGPEHGVRGDAPAGAKISNEVDPRTGVPVYSLYGPISKPTDEMLKDVDVLLFDIQDVGVRFYTYIGTLSLAMEAAAEHKIPFVVLDRPNPIRGTWVEGFNRDDSLRFRDGPVPYLAGWQPVVIAEGMTVGELATTYNNEGWLTNGVKASLTVVKMEKWKRTMWYDQTGLKVWVAPSPNLPTLASCVVYPGTCLFEGVNISEGRGTERPFENIGAPFIDGLKWANMLNEYKLKGVKFKPVEFTPRSIEHVAMNPKYEGEKCGGVLIKVTDREVYEPVKVGVYMLASVKELFGDKVRWRQSKINRLSGTPKLTEAIDAGVPPEKIVPMWKDDVDKFKKVRSKHLLY
ncbi:MAG: hypothetical protein HW389_2811 [Bacteroidetes bacterium]|nr:hypothetical protein [Bacteroidota bacterium]MBM2839998.1 hypothetical protein [Bacteroidota bacterium]